jgi:hypothetical protein
MTSSNWSKGLRVQNVISNIRTSYGDNGLDRVLPANEHIQISDGLC